MKKRIVSLVISFVMLAGILIYPVSSAEGGSMPFKDVKAGKWYFKSVEYVYENGYMNGVTPDRFDPNGNLTRGMVVTILCRMDGGKPELTGAFSDVKPKKWYAGYVGWASKNGLVNGYSDGTFKPEANITRQEMAAVISRYIEYAGIRMPRRFTAPAEFTDTAKIGKWAKTHVETLRRAGIFNGDTAGKYNPQSEITRAETATVVMNLISAKDLAWQGYDPLDTDGPVIIGAKYLYDNASQIRGTLATDIDLSGDFPVLDAYYDSFKAGYTYDYLRGGYGGRNRMNSIGVSIRGIDLSIYDHPVMKVAYKYVDYDEPDALDGSYQHNFEEEYGTNHKHRDPFVFVKGENDGEFSTGTFDFTEKYASDTFDFELDNLNLLICPFDESYRGEIDGKPGGLFKIAYIAFFPDQASADAFTLGSASPEIKDYIYNYKLYTELFYEYADGSLRAEYDKKLTDRIGQIMDSKSEVSPEDVTARGGTVYYLSSFRGDDNNDGLSPDKPLKSISSLWTYKAGGQVRLSKVRPGDGVFFERGSVYFPERYGGTQIITLDVCDGVTYGAYGKGPKPQFTHAVDFGITRSDENATGTWLKTEWDNVWVLDSELSAFSDPVNGGHSDGSCSNIVINHGEYVGVRMAPKKLSDEAVSPFSEDDTSRYFGMMCNGREWFECGNTPMTNPGTVLTHNLEFIHDPSEHKLYMYCDLGNPMYVFDDIKCSTDGYVLLGYSEASFTGAKGTRLDNLSILYSGSMGAMLSGDGLVMSNCEIGWCSGSLSSIESGKEANGSSQNETVYNCYLHDIGDGPLSTQFEVDWDPDSKPKFIKNTEYYNNVIVSSGNAVESLCYNETQRDETGIYGKNKQLNFHIHDNIFAYIGYGITEQQIDGDSRPVKLMINGEVVEGGSHKGGEVYCSTGEKVNCVIENNIIMYTCGITWSNDFSTDAHRRGWISRNNTYLCDNRYTVFLKAEADIDHFVLNEPIKKFTNESMPYNERYLAYFTSKGVEEGSKFYWFEDDDPHLPFWGSFTDGYYIANGTGAVK